MKKRAEPSRLRKNPEPAGDALDPIRVDVYVQPRASRTAVIGTHDGCVKIALAAPPVDGAANTALIELVAEQLAIAKSRVRIVAGLGSRRKTLELDGVSADAFRAVFGDSAAATRGGARRT